VRQQLSHSRLPLRSLIQQWQQRFHSSPNISRKLFRVLCRRKLLRRRTITSSPNSLLRSRSLHTSNLYLSSNQCPRQQRRISTRMLPTHLSSSQVNIRCSNRQPGRADIRNHLSSSRQLAVSSY
jgi:hypothetical protein